nr:hypothetical protein [Candidatus Woesebacteria bacterium]
VEYIVNATNNSFSQAELSSRIEAVTGIEPQEDLLDGIFSELQIREKLYGQNPPFKVENNLVEPLFEWHTCPEYTTCLILNMEGAADESTRIGKLFERISCEAMRNYVGGESFVCGFPSRITVKDIADKLFARYSLSPPTHVKDRGLDVVTWKNFEDKRNNHLIIFLQCASGRNWHSKITDLEMTAWNNYITWGSQPIKGFAIPYIIEQDKFLEVSFSAGLILDRIRIYKYLAPSGHDNKLRSELISWCEERLAD